MLSPPSQLFLTRLWREPRSGDDSGVRIQIRHVLSGETVYFRHWSDAIRYLVAKLDQPPFDGGRKEEDEY